MSESAPTVGRWLAGDPDGWWECDGSAPARCMWLHGPSVSACGACGTKRPPMTETPAPRVDARVGTTACIANREAAWVCNGPDCHLLHVWRVESCDRCGTVRPAEHEYAPSSSEIPNNSSEDAIERIARNYVSDINFTRSVGVVDALLSYEDRKALVRAGMALTDAQVVGKEPIAGVDDAVRVTEAMVEAFKREWIASHEANAGTWDSRIHGLLTAALRAVPVEGREPVCYAATRDGHPVLPNAIRAHKHEAQRHAELLGPEFYTVPLYAHPAPDGEVRDA